MEMDLRALTRDIPGPGLWKGVRSQDWAEGGDRQQCTPALLSILQAVLHGDLCPSQSTSRLRLGLHLPTLSQAEELPGRLTMDD